jgi:endonuclease YncB( thermonuclease family)
MDLGLNLIESLYVYKVENIVRCKDGDTAIIEVNQGFDDDKTTKIFRFHGINCPEKRRATLKEYYAAKAYLEQLCATLPKPFYLKSFVDKTKAQDSLLRYLCILVDAEQRSINQMMIDAGHAVAWTPNQK